MSDGTIVAGSNGVSEEMIDRDTTAPPYSHASVTRRRCENGVVRLAESNGSRPHAINTSRIADGHS